MIPLKVLALASFSALTSITSFALDCESSWPPEVVIVKSHPDQAPNHSDLISSPNLEIPGTGASENTSWKIDSGVTITHWAGQRPHKTGSACVSIPPKAVISALYCGVSNEGQALTPCYSLAAKKECPLGYIINTAVHMFPKGTQNPSRVCVDFVNSSGKQARHIGIIVRVKREQ